MRAILIQRHGIDMGDSMRKWKRGQGRVGFIRVDDPSYCYQQAKKRKDLLTQEARVIKSKSPYWNYMFARNIPGTNVSEHEKIVKASRNFKYIFKFAREVHGADVRGLGRIIAVYGDSYWNYIFARYVSGANIKDHANAVISLGNMEINYKFSRDLQGADKERFFKSILKHNNYEEFVNYMKKQHECFEYFEQEIMELDDPTLCYLIAKDIKGADIKRCGFSVILSKNPELCYKFARDIHGVDIFPYEKVVLDSRDIKWNYLFAKDIKNANIQAHIKRIGSVFDNNIIEELNHISQDRAKQKKLKKGLD